MTPSPPPFALPGRYAYANETLAGGQGAVYICNDANLDRKVAVKALHTSSNASILLKEVEARAMIKSKHVVEVYDMIFDPHQKPVALILEYIPGKSLQDATTVPAAFEQRLLLLYQIACALTEIHAAGVIHRDIKPDNMKLDGDGILKIYDLGISNLDADNASTVGAAGTYTYRAPELYWPPVKVTCAVDIYAFGVIAWHIFAPKLPACLTEIPPQNSGAPLPSILTVAPELKTCAPLLDLALSVDPVMRPSAEDIKRHLCALLTDGRQRGIFTHAGKIWEVGKPGSLTGFTVGAVSVKVSYNGSSFIVREIKGSVFANNLPISVDSILPASCVLTFGGTEQGASRVFMPFNSAQPEIVL